MECDSIFSQQLNFQPIHLSFVAFGAGVSNGRHCLSIALPFVIAYLILCDRIRCVFWRLCIQVTFGDQAATFGCDLLHILYLVSLLAVVRQLSQPLVRTTSGVLDLSTTNSRDASVSICNFLICSWSTPRDAHRLRSPCTV